MDLNAFCSSTLDDLSNPFRRDGWMYYSDGRIMVRVKSPGEDSSHGRAVQGMLDGHPEPDKEIDLPRLRDVRRKIKCPACMGRGCFDLTVGDPKQLCHNCIGMGCWLEFKMVPVMGKVFNGGYLWLISCLDDVKFNDPLITKPKWGDCAALRFSFKNRGEAGSGLLMSTARTIEEAKTETAMLLCHYERSTL